jgi:DtxR family Mn-dependent transcriptional regulator
MSKLISLSASLEDYIEDICHIVAEKKVARGKEIAKRL